MAEYPELTARGRRTRERIVETAAALMHRNGAGPTSLDEILAQSGAGKSQLYHFFGSRADLTRAVIAHQWEAVRTAFHVDEPGPATWKHIRAWIDTAMDIQHLAGTPMRCPLGSLAYEITGTDPNARAQLDQIFTDWAGHLAEGLASMKERGLLRDSANPHHLAMATLATIEGGIMLAYTRNDLAPLRIALDGAYELLRSYAIPK